MDQRSNLIHPTLRHPRTGEPLMALGEIGGKVIWPVLGGSGEGDNGNADGESESTEGKGTEGESKSTEGEKASEKTAETVSKEEYERLHNRMTAADKRSSDLQAQLKAFEDKDKTELQKATEDRETAIRERDESVTALRNLRVENAFLTVDGVSWHNKSDALKMLLADYMDDIKVDDQGKVTGVDTAVKKMAREKAYLVKTETVASTGDQMNGQRKGDGSDKNKKARDEGLRSRMPALG